MNYAPYLGTTVCAGCRVATPDDEMSAEQAGYCEPCGNERQAEIDSFIKAPSRYA